MPQVGSFRGISMLAGMLIVLMLSGCAKRLGGAQAPVAIVELAGQLQLAWERPIRKANGTFLIDIAATNFIGSCVTGVRGAVTGAHPLN
jgi:hypothetical protein